MNILSIFSEPDRRVGTITKLSNHNIACFATNWIANVDVQKSITILSRVSQRFLMENGTTTLLVCSSRRIRPGTQIYTPLGTVYRSRTCRENPKTSGEHVNTSAAFDMDTD